MFEHSVTCPHCGKQILEDWSDYVVDSSVIDEDRGMGAETEHTIECDDFQCPYCGKSFSVSGSVWEYPEGAYNDHELTASI